MRTFWQYICMEQKPLRFLLEMVFASNLSFYKKSVVTCRNVLQVAIDFLLFSEKEYDIIIIKFKKLLRNNNINPLNIEEWLQSIDSDHTKTRLQTYYDKINNKK